MKFEDFELSVNDSVKTIKIDNKEVNILQYLPIGNKNDLIQISLQQSEEDGIYNETLLTAYFYTYVVFFYSDIEFSDEDKQNVLSIYDILTSQGMIEMVLSAIPSSEWEDLKDGLQAQKEMNITYRKSATYLLGQFINELPNQMSKVGEIIDNFDPSKYAEVVNFATAANGGRNIVTNEKVAAVVK